MSSAREQLAALVGALSEAEAAAALPVLAAAVAGDVPAPARRPLPARRPAVTQHVHVGAHSIFLTTGAYPNGRLGEVAIEIHREGAPLRGAYGALAGVLSVALQHAVPLEQLAAELIGIQCEPAGEVRGHRTIRCASSIPDYLGLALLAASRAAHAAPSPCPSEDDRGSPADADD